MTVAVAFQATVFVRAESFVAERRLSLCSGVAPRRTRLRRHRGINPTATVIPSLRDGSRRRTQEVRWALQILLILLILSLLRRPGRAQPPEPAFVPSPLLPFGTPALTFRRSTKV